MHMTARMNQREAFIEERHFRIGAHVIKVENPTEHARKTARGETK